MHWLWRYNWNTIENGIEHHTIKKMFGYERERVSILSLMKRLTHYETVPKQKGCWKFGYNQHFLFFHQNCFLPFLYYNDLSLIKLRNGQHLVFLCPHLILSQTTNFRCFKTERVCRWQLHIWWKWQKVFETGKKHDGKRRNCSLRAISPFPTVFSKYLYCRHIKTRACLGKG